MPSLNSPNIIRKEKMQSWTIFLSVFLSVPVCLTSAQTRSELGLRAGELCLGNGSKCREDIPCCSEQCIHGICDVVCGPEYEYCQYDTDCSCTGGRCVACAREGSFCRHHCSCCSKMCFSGMC
ncbi:unnamed protein product [Allacma fusca]|uniref:Uncharacterized protein n=1 Tax=Allacma fusca TaxID=39272 RepID=A0A8J2PJI3_9HEXA|nr:unnamed protein product [Allacma fusca]